VALAHKCDDAGVNAYDDGARRCVGYETKNQPRLQYEHQDPELQPDVVAESKERQSRARRAKQVKTSASRNEAEV